MHKLKADDSWLIFASLLRSVSKCRAHKGTFGCVALVSTMGCFEDRGRSATRS
jgi:hypothetical protein